MLTKFTGWSTFSQQASGVVMIDRGEVAAVEGSDNGRGVTWSRVHLKTGTTLDVYEDADTVQRKLSL